MDKKTMNSGSHALHRIGIAALLSAILVSLASANDWKSVLDLRGKWKFELGDDQKRASASYDDSKWEEIFVPSAWEDEGYPGYDGYAWYRRHFRLPAGAEQKSLYLRLGCIDDVSEVFLNGHLIGITGSFPPDFMTAYNVEVVLFVPQSALNISGDNVIAVRVYDDQLAGGIVNGKIGLYESKSYLAPDLPLSGNWKFKKGDAEKYMDRSFDDKNWDEVFVPAYWESQGYPDYDGLAWYRLHFQIPDDLAGKTLILVLGKIDDFDETYVNGEEVGRTGRIRSNVSRIKTGNEYRELRAYTLPSGLVKAGQDNVIAVRVYDGQIGGGIYQGPIGIVTREHYREWRKNRPWHEEFQHGPWEFFERLFD
jgi:hypothetical protein